MNRLVLRYPRYNTVCWWYYSYSPIDNDDVLNRIIFGQCFTAIPLNLEHLTCLIINTPLFYIDAKVLNRFQHLEHLEFLNLIFQEGGSPKITLPHLKVLQIGCAANNHDGSAVDAPGLEILSCDQGLSGIQIPHSKSVKHLQIGDKQRDLKKFENVEVFRCFEPESIITDLFAQLPKLKEIHFVDGHYKEICAKFLDFNETKTTINWLIEQKKSLGKAELKLHFLGELLDDDSKMFEDYKFNETFSRIFKD